MNENRLKTFSFLLLLFTAIAGCSQSRNKPISEVSQKDLKNGILVDVRTPEEYHAGHLEGARNINLYMEDFVSMANNLPKEKTLYVYCKKGGRSARAAEVLDSLGYDVVNLLGGYDAWSSGRQ